MHLLNYNKLEEVCILNLNQKFLCTFTKEMFYTLMQRIGGDRGDSQSHNIDYVTRSDG